MPRLIFVIGAARSGTHLVASTIAQAFPEAQYLSELNEFWSRFALNKQDLVDEKKFSMKHLDRIRYEFLQLSEGADVVIEKTAANCLRIDFLKLLFPCAEFVFVQRRCSQVVKSVLKKQQGNINKISDSRDVTLLMRFETLNDRIRAKLLRVKHTPESVFQLLTRNFDNFLNILNLRADIHWGPKFCSKKDRLKIMHPEVYALMQWAVCDFEIRKNKEKKSEKNIFLEFNEILDEPESTAIRLQEFLVCSELKFNIDDRAGRVVIPSELVFYDLMRQFDQV